MEKKTLVTFDPYRIIEIAQNTRYLYAVLKDCNVVLKLCNVIIKELNIWKTRLI